MNLRTTGLKALAAAWIALFPLASCGVRIPVSKTEPVGTVRVPVKPDTSKTREPRDPDVLVWLIADKYHTGMVFPYDWLVESGFVPPKGFGSTKYVTLSWGNRDAYSKQGIDTKWKLFRVLFTPTPSVMELIPSDWNITEVLPDQRIYRRLTPRDKGPALAAFLNACAKQGPDGLPIVVCESSWGEGVQLEGRYPYFIPRVCNVWTVQCIENIGGRINPWFALTADGLIREAVKPPNDFEQIWPGGGVPKR